MISASGIKALYEYHVSGLAETLHLKVYIKEKPKKQSEHENYYYKKSTRLCGCFFDRQLPTLPGRLQPSTIGLCVLNYCVRNGNRWNHASIVTECVRKHLCSLKTIQKKVTEHLRSSRIPYLQSGQRHPISFAFPARFSGRFRIRPVSRSAAPFGFASRTGQ